MTTMILEEFLKAIAEKLQANHLTGVDSTLGFHLEGEGGGDWFLTIRDGQCEIKPGIAAQPDAVLETNVEDFIKMLTDSQEEIGWAFMQGRFNMTGNIMPLWRVLATVRQLRIER